VPISPREPGGFQGRTPLATPGLSPRVAITFPAVLLRADGAGLGRVTSAPWPAHQYLNPLPAQKRVRGPSFRACCPAGGRCAAAGPRSVRQRPEWPNGDDARRNRWCSPPHLPMDPACRRGLWSGGRSALAPWPSTAPYLEAGSEHAPRCARGPPRNGRGRSEQEISPHSRAILCAPSVAGDATRLRCFSTLLGTGALSTR